MKEISLEIMVSEDDFYDIELNFKGKTHTDIIENWKARLERMLKLKALLGDDYTDFCDEFINNIADDNHISKGCVKFYVGIK